MRRLAIPFAALLLLVPVCAQANGLLERTGGARSWSGVFLGASVGYRFGGVAWTHNENIGTDEDFSVDPAGLTGGVVFGYQRQISRVVLGLEATALVGQVQASQRSGPGAINPGNPRDRTAVLSDHLSLSGRVGFTPGRDWLVYGKLGVTLTDIEINHRLVSTGFVFPANRWDLEPGYTIGAGVAYRITDAVSIGLDYAYVDPTVRNSVSYIANSDCNGFLCGDTLRAVDISLLQARIVLHF